MVRTNLIDYLENHLIKHLLLVQDREMQTFIVRDVEVEAEVLADVEKAEETEQGKPLLFTEGDRDELENLLQEFLA